VEFAGGDERQHGDEDQRGNPEGRGDAPQQGRIGQHDRRPDLQRADRLSGQVDAGLGKVRALDVDCQVIGKGLG